MATNKPYGDNHRQGAVKDRSQVHNPQNDRWIKRDLGTGKFIDQKANKEPFKSGCEEREVIILVTQERET
ncbi:MAG TPA: hypothetical protein VJ440_07630 [Candidatus Brocadiaceae bacterium]|nr:hypothetical protein [Candidatus Brocadiaceae bacterium]